MFFNLPFTKRFSRMDMKTDRAAVDIVLVNALVLYQKNNNNNNKSYIIIYTKYLHSTLDLSIHETDQ